MEIDTKPRRLPITLGPAHMAMLERLKLEMEAGSYSEVVRELLRRNAAGWVADPAPPAPAPVVVTVAEAVIPSDELAVRRDRGLVAAFLRIDGREWKGSGPTPLEPGCTVSAAVLAEYAGQLAALRVRLERLAAEEQRFAAGGGV